MNKFDTLYEKVKQEMSFSTLVEMLRKSNKFPLRKETLSLLDEMGISKSDQDIVEAYFEMAIEEAAMDLGQDLEDDSKVFGGQRTDWNSKLIKLIASSMKSFIDLNPNMLT